MSVHYTQTVEVLRAPLVEDRYGNGVRDWASAARTTVRRVAVQPADSTEGNGDRQAVTSSLRLITRRGADIDLTAGDRVVALGWLLDVDGEPERFTVSGRLHHVEARLVQVVG